MRKLRPADDDAIRSSIVQASLCSAEFRFLHRLHAVLLVSVGCSCYDVARWFGDDPRSVERWIHRYERGCLDGLRDQPRRGQAGRLTAFELGRLQYDVTREPNRTEYCQPHWSGKLLARHIGQQFGVALSERQCQRLLLRLRAATAMRHEHDVRA